MSIRRRHISAKFGRLTMNMSLKDWRKAEDAYDPDIRYECKYGGKSYHFDHKGSLLDYLVEFDRTVLCSVGADHTVVGVCYASDDVLHLVMGS